MQGPCAILSCVINIILSAIETRLIDITLLVLGFSVRSISHLAPEQNRSFALNAN